MDFLGGKNLQELIEAQHFFNEEAVCELAVQVLLGLRAIHAIGVVHCDVKPANVRLHPRLEYHSLHAVLLDWGYARPSSVGWWAVVSEETRTAAGQVLPRGCLVRYRELYTAEAANVGRRWTAEQLGAEVARLSAGEHIAHTPNNWLNVCA
jgi:serine/threonine protein kinase